VQFLIIVNILFIFYGQLFVSSLTAVFLFPCTLCDLMIVIFVLGADSVCWLWRLRGNRHWKSQITALYQSFYSSATGCLF